MNIIKCFEEKLDKENLPYAPRGRANNAATEKVFISKCVDVSVDAFLRRKK